MASWIRRTSSMPSPVPWRRPQGHRVHAFQRGFRQPTRPRPATSRAHHPGTEQELSPQAGTCLLSAMRCARWTREPTPQAGTPLRVSFKLRPLAAIRGCAPRYTHGRESLHHPQGDPRTLLRHVERHDMGQSVPQGRYFPETPNVRGTAFRDMSPIVGARTRRPIVGAPGGRSSAGHRHTLPQRRRTGSGQREHPVQTPRPHEFCRMPADLPILLPTTVPDALTRAESAAFALNDINPKVAEGPGCRSSPPLGQTCEFGALGIAHP
jgi:hypothetical protein